MQDSKFTINLLFNEITKRKARYPELVIVTD
jgi:hypothetical protein